MSIEEICQWLENSTVGTTIIGSNWLFPIIEGTHVLALGLAVGLVVLSDLRLIGVIMRNKPASVVWSQLMPWMTGGMTVMFISGGLLFWSQATKAYASTYFQIKMLLLIAAAVNALAYHLTIYKRMKEWDLAPIPPPRARLAGWVSLILWTSVIIMGRTMAYTSF
jgi:uncharacterized protein DUF6644